MRNIVLPIVGFANGIIVGSGIVALITLLDIIPRLAQLTKTYKYISTYEDVISFSAVIASYFSLTKTSLNFSSMFVIILGFFMGFYIGMLASALAEVMNVVPVVVSRFVIDEYVIYVVYALILGKVVGSLIQWLIIY